MTDDELLEAAGVSTESNTTKKTKKTKEEIEQPKNEASQYLGTKLNHNIATGRTFEEEDAAKNLAKTEHLTKVGENISNTALIKDGWLTVDRTLLGERNVFYPSDWEFRIKPATVEAIRNWSTLDENNLNSIDTVFNEMLKECLSITTNTGNIIWSKINSWDRFFFILLIREYTFLKGEKKVEFTEDCINCDNPVTFTLDSQSLMFDIPDSDVMRYYDSETRSWNINPAEFGDDTTDELYTFYLPTLEKEINMKMWMYEEARENPNKKFDPKFVQFLQWIAPKISKDSTLAKKQIRQYEVIFKSWGTDTFLFINDIINNIAVTPKDELIAVCPKCGEEVTTKIRFQDGISSLFAVRSKFRKFGKK